MASLKSFFLVIKSFIEFDEEVVEEEEGIMLVYGGEGLGEMMS